jgi:hypothetical protein
VQTAERRVDRERHAPFCNGYPQMVLKKGIKPELPEAQAERERWEKLKGP